jgi:hypothetical protein
MPRAITTTVLTVIASILILLAPATAAEVTVNFTGTLDEATDPVGLLGVAVGDSFSGTFTYESTTPFVAATGFPGALTAGSLVVDGNPFAFNLAGHNLIQVANDAPFGALTTDIFQVEADLAPAYGYNDLSFVLTLVDFRFPGGDNPDALDSDALPTALNPDDFGPFIVKQFVITLSGVHAPEDRLRLAGDLAHVPEPSTIALTLVSLVLLGGLTAVRR